MTAPESPSKAPSGGRVALIAYVVFTLIGLAVVYVVGNIAWTAFRNGGLVPPPTQLNRYTCKGPMGEFSVAYLHGTDRVQIKSDQGLLEGTIQQNRFDWQGFGEDRHVLGFLPPKEVAFEDRKSLRLGGGDFDQMVCNNTQAAGAERRAVGP